MKIHYLILIVFACFTACQNQDNQPKDVLALAKDSSNFTTIQWIDSLKDIGAVEAGKKLK